MNNSFQRIMRQIQNDKQTVNHIQKRINNILSSREFRKVNLPPEMIDHILSFMPIEDVNATKDELEYLIEMRNDLLQRIRDNVILVQA